MSDAIGGWKIVRLAYPHAEAVHPVPAPADQDRPLLADQPRAEPSTLQRQSGLHDQLPALVTDQVAEQPQRRRLGGR